MLKMLFVHQPKILAGTSQEFWLVHQLGFAVGGAFQTKIVTSQNFWLPAKFQSHKPKKVAGTSLESQLPVKKISWQLKILTGHQLKISAASQEKWQPPKFLAGRSLRVVFLTEPSSLNVTGLVHVDR